MDTGKTNIDWRGRYPNGAKYNSFGLFLQDEMALNSKWTTIFGVRVSYFHTKFSIPNDSSTPVNLKHVTQNFQSLTGSCGFIYKLNDQFFFDVNIGQAFRAPNLSDISKLGESKGNTYEIPNLNLEPEKMVSFEVGVKLNFTSLKANASAYYAQITDLLASADAAYNGSSTIVKDGNVYNVKTKKNIGIASIRGFETAIDYNFYQYLYFHSNITTTYGHNTTNDEPVGGIPPTFGLVSIKWRGSVYSFEIYMRFATKQDRLSTDDKDDPRIPEDGTPRWQTYNFRAGFKVLKFVDLQFAVENIFDYNYREHGSGINGPGRNFIASLALNK